jgi:hypothetical protein
MCNAGMSNCPSRQQRVDSYGNCTFPCSCTCPHIPSIAPVHAITVSTRVLQPSPCALQSSLHIVVTAVYYSHHPVHCNHYSTLQSSLHSTVHYNHHCCIIVHHCCITVHHCTLQSPLRTTITTITTLDYTLTFYTCTLRIAHTHTYATFTCHHITFTCHCNPSHRIMD